VTTELSSGYLVGAAVLVIDENNRVLLGLRAKEQVWASFGGRLEPAESASAGALREVTEETGIVLESLERLAFGEGVKADGTPFVTVYYYARLPAGQTPVVREPELFTQMGWFALDSLPSNMWERERSVFEQLRSLV
jgi:ADP-ribose pyrophosphatase YjhB (NUDIX family)